MGNPNSKQTELKGDPKLMELRFPGSTARLPDWRKKHGFDGTLDVSQCKALVQKLQLKRQIEDKRDQETGHGLCTEVGAGVLSGKENRRKRDKDLHTHHAAIQGCVVVYRDRVGRDVICQKEVLQVLVVHGRSQG